MLYDTRQSNDYKCVATSQSTNTEIQITMCLVLVLRN